MTEVTLFGYAPSTYVRTARLALEEKGVPYTLNADFELGSPEHAAQHPFSRMPWLRHGDFVLWETSAILRYVDEAFDGPALTPADPRDRAQMEQWISAINCYLDPLMVRTVLLERFLAPKFGREPDETKIAEAMPEVVRQVGLIEAQLSDRPYMAGETASLADFFLLPILYYLYLTPEGKPPLEDSPNIMAWWGRVSSRPSFTATQPPQAEAAE